MDRERAVNQLKEIEKLASKIRLAADGWDEDWKTLIATLMSARTTDKKTIPVATALFDKFNTVRKLSKARNDQIAKIIKPVNFYKTKSRNIYNLSKILFKTYHSLVPHDFDKLIELPGVGRKTANVFLAELGQSRIGVDTHLTYISNYLGWTKHKEQHKIELDLERLFPERFWSKLNWILVRFGQTYTNRRIKNNLLNKIKKIK